MTDWRACAETGAWELVNIHHLKHSERRVFLSMVREAVPTVPVADELDPHERYAHPSELEDPGLKAAANILAKGELEAIVDAWSRMTDWRECAEASAWELINIIHLDDDECRELLPMAYAVVPKITVQNGLERHERYALPSELEDAGLKAAAKILEMGELEAIVEGLPPLASEEWSQMTDEAKSMLREKTGDEGLGQDAAEPMAPTWAAVKSELERVLKAVASTPEYTVGDEDMSQRAHADTAMERFSNIDFVIAAMVAELDCDGDKPWLKEGIAEIASLAYLAGRHTHHALGKKIEAAAIARFSHDAQNRKNAALGGSEKKQKAARAKAKLRELALEPATFERWRDKNERQKVSELKQIARSYDRDQEASERLFSGQSGEIFSSKWFQNWIDEWRADGAPKKYIR